MGETGSANHILGKGFPFCKPRLPTYLLPRLLVLYHVKPRPPGQKVAQHFWSRSGLRRKLPSRIPLLLCPSGNLPSALLKITRCS